MPGARPFTLTLMGAQLEGQGPCEHADGSLGAVVVGTAHVRHVLVHRGDVDDLSSPTRAGAELGEATAAEEVAVDVGADRLVPELGGQLGDLFAGGVDTGVVHEASRVPKTLVFGSASSARRPRSFA